MQLHKFSPIPQAMLDGKVLGRFKKPSVPGEDLDFEFYDETLNGNAWADSKVQYVTRCAQPPM